MSSQLDLLFQDLEASLEERAAPFSVDGDVVLIYGAGAIGRDVCGVLVRHGATVLGFLDRAALPGQRVSGLPVYLPHDAPLSSAERRRATVIIATHNPSAQVPELRRNLTSQGYRQVVTFLDVHERWAGDFGDRFWLTRRNLYLGNRNACLATEAIWTDDSSRDLFRSILRFRTEKAYEALPAPSGEVQYFDRTVPFPGGPLRFIDCGAYDGDTLAQLIQMGLHAEAILAFEPEPKNFDKLAQFVHGHRGSLPSQTFLYPCGVAASNAQVRLSGTGTSAHLSQSGDTVIQCVCIDDAAPSFAPTYLKMDIEGAELEALHGARRTIEGHRPSLAICLYHRPEHLWQIPLLVHGWYGDRARYYLRLYAHNGFELVFYAIASESP